MDAGARSRTILFQEGQAIQAAVGDDGPAILKAVIDGWMNALIRIEGSRDAAVYAFALADRVVAGVREPTPEAGAVEVELPKLPPRPAPSDDAERWAYFLVGFVVAWLAWRA